MLSQQILTQKPFCRRRSKKRDNARINQSLAAYLRSDAILLFAKKPWKAGLPSSKLSKLTKREEVILQGTDEERAQDLNSMFC